MKITVQDLEFDVETEHDPHADAPWDIGDGHGPVRSVRARYGLAGSGLKRSGERVLHWNGYDVWFYDWAAACKKAREEGWNAAPYDAPNRIERAAQADFDHLRAYLRQDWYYCAVTVTGPDGKSESLAYVEYQVYEKNAYVEETARELADNLAYEILKERAEVQYWAERDVVTV